MWLRNRSWRVRGRRRGAMTAFHSTTVRGVPASTRRGDSTREKKRRHSYHEMGATFSRGRAFQGRSRAKAQVTSWARAA